MKSTICKSICILVMPLSGVCALSAKGGVTIGMQLDSLKQHYGVSFVYDSSGTIRHPVSMLLQSRGSLHFPTIP